MNKDNLFFELKSTFYYKFVVADSDENLWSKLLRDKGIKFKILYTGHKEGWSYHCRIIRIKKKDKGLIPEIAQKVNDTFLMMGFKDYPEFRNMLFETILSGKEDIKDGSIK